MAFRIYLLSRWFHDRRIPLKSVLLRALNRILFATVLPPGARIGKNVLFSYNGLGTVVHKRAVIGDHAVIGTTVTIGGRAGHEAVPDIGEGTMIGSGAKILGPVKIGRYASIGANAVVLEDVPDYGVAVGAPARVIRINSSEQIPDYRTFNRQG